MQEYFISDDMMQGYIYGIKHDYVPFTDRYNDLDDSIIFNSIDDAKLDLQALQNAGFTRSFIIDGNSNKIKK